MSSGTQQKKKKKNLLQKAAEKWNRGRQDRNGHMQSLTSVRGCQNSDKDGFERQFDDDEPYAVAGLAAIQMIKEKTDMQTDTKKR
jgi:hypothetical protein